MPIKRRYIPDVIQRTNGLMVSALDSGSKGPGDRAQAEVIVFLGKTLYSNSAYQEYKCVPANCQKNLMKFWGGGGGGPAIN